MTPEPHWTTILSALLMPTVAVFGVFIAYFQWRTNQNKLKLDLFDKRYRVYVAVHEFLSSIQHYQGNDDRIPDNYITTFKTERGKAKWLFDDNISSYFKKINNQANRLKILIAELEDEDADNTENIHTKAEILTWLEKQKDSVLDDICKPFLKVKS